MTEYDAFRRGDVYAVYALDADHNSTGEPLSSHVTRSQAIVKMRKLYEDADESDYVPIAASPTVKPATAHMSKAYIAPAPPSWLSRRKASLAVYKGSDGLRYMFIITSNGYQDRDEETILTKALSGYVEKAWSVEGKCLPGNPLLFWHKGQPIGDIVWTDMHGTFLLEVAKERRNARVKVSAQHTTTIKQLWDAFETAHYSWGASHGFKYPDSAKQGKEYLNIAKFETSILPLDVAANPYTFSGVINDMNRDQVLNDLLKVPDLASKFRKNINQIGKALDRQGLVHKTVNENDLDGSKALLEDVRTLVTKIAGKFSDSPDPAAIDSAVQMLVSGMASMTPTAADDPEDVADNGVDEATETAPVSDGMSAKQIKLLDVLVRSQEAQAEDMGDMAGAMKAIAEAVQPIPGAQKSLEDKVSALADKVNAVEKRLSGAPKRAATDERTVVKDKDLTDKVKEQQEKYEELFPGSGIKLRSNGSE